VNTKANR